MDWGHHVDWYLVFSLNASALALVQDHHLRTNQLSSFHPSPSAAPDIRVVRPLTAPTYTHLPSLRFRLCSPYTHYSITPQQQPAENCQPWRSSCQRRKPVGSTTRVKASSSAFPSSCGLLSTRTCLTFQVCTFGSLPAGMGRVSSSSPHAPRRQ